MAKRRETQGRKAAKHSPSPLEGEGREGGGPRHEAGVVTPLGAASGASSPSRGERDLLGNFPDPVSPRENRVLLGDIGRAQGLKGEVRIRSFTQDPAAIASYGPLEDETGARLIEIERVRSDGKNLVASIKGVASREAAEALTGTKLYLPRGRLPAHGADEWYHADLIGLAVRDANGTTFGRVTAVHNFGASDIIEIKHADGSELLVPFNDEAVPEVNVAEGWLVVVPPEIIEDEE